MEHTILAMATQIVLVSFSLSSWSMKRSFYLLHLIVILLLKAITNSQQGLAFSISSIITIMS